MNAPYYYAQTGEAFGVFNSKGIIVDAFVYEETAAMFTDLKNAQAMNEEELHSHKFKAKKAIEKLLSHSDMSEAADAAVLLTKGTGIVEIKDKGCHIVYALMFNGRHTARLSRKNKPRFSPICMIGEEPSSPVLDQIRVFNAQFGK